MKKVKAYIGQLRFSQIYISLSTTIVASDLVPFNRPSGLMYQRLDECNFRLMSLAKFSKQEPDKLEYLI